MNRSYENLHTTGFLILCEPASAILDFYFPYYSFFPIMSYLAQFNSAYIGTEQ